ncbi:poly-gamma-glutamate hydrolase family protein [Hahella sp. NBU794]|uniref:poly-gamma-glutamate hydrolase family protein n=1 Tax=Hahella sp. NBU794 TaxID=3422590 RepID=UPI003D6DBED8
MTDTYNCYEELSKSQQEGRDFLVKVVKREHPVAIIGPHAGKIELGTSELVIAIADEDCPYYLFEGIKDRSNKDLHITSTNFDEPLAIELLSICKTAIAIHGEASNKEDVYIGGLDEELRRHLSRSLTAYNFNVTRHERLQGVDPRNICNRTLMKKGVQIELPKGLRRRMFESLTEAGRPHKQTAFYSFVTSIREGIQSYVQSRP